MEKYAINVGYVFNVFPVKELIGIELEKLNVLVELHGDIYPLYRCKKFEDSRRVDDLLDTYGEYKVLDHVHL